MFQAQLGKRKWTLFYLPVACMAVSVPLFMMGGVPRPIIAALLAGFGLWTLYRRWRSGWRFETPNQPEHTE
jgi:hypothetical protein